MKTPRAIAKQSLFDAIARYEEAEQKLFGELVGREEEVYILDNLDTFSIGRIYGLRDEYNLRAGELITDLME